MLARTKKTMETTRTSGLRSSMMKRGHLGKCEKSMANGGMDSWGVLARRREEERRRGRVELESQKKEKRKSGEIIETKRARERERERDEGKPKTKRGEKVENKACAAVGQGIKVIKIVNINYRFPGPAQPGRQHGALNAVSPTSAESTSRVELMYTTLPSRSLKFYPGHLHPIDRVMDLGRNGCHAAFRLTNPFNSQRLKLEFKPPPAISGVSSSIPGYLRQVRYAAANADHCESA